MLKQMLFACDADTSRRYKLTILDSPGGFYSIPHAIINRGQVAGASVGINGGLHATIWNGTAATDLGAATGEISVAYDINDAGQAVGLTSRTGNYYPISWSGAASATDLETLGGGGAAHGINNSGRIVGASAATRIL